MSYKEDFSSRLKHERERLGLSQSKFAESCGIGNTTQYNYEKGEREPAVSYLLAAERVGVDLQYLLHGVVTRESVTGDDPMKLIEFAFDINRDDLIHEFIFESPNQGGLLFDEIARLSPVFDSAAERRYGLDAALFSDIFVQVNATLDALGLALTPSKQADTVVMLYRLFKPEGRVYQATLEKVVKRVAS